MGVKCEKIISNCFKCSSPQGICTECQEGFQIVEKNDGTTICLSSTSQLFYFDNDLSKYKLCSEHGSFSNCEKCQTTEDNNFECLSCETNYAFAHGNIEPAPCELIESLLEEYYPEDENNYYSCQSTAYHQVENCEKCFTKDKCHQPHIRLHDSETDHKEKQIEKERTQQ